jgi:hypothetical protein
VDHFEKREDEEVEGYRPQEEDEEEYEGKEAGMDGAETMWEKWRRRCTFRKLVRRMLWRWRTRRC